MEVHFTRISFAREEVSQLLEMENHIDDAVDLLSQAGVDIILFNCTTGSLVKGLGYDKLLINKMESRSGVMSMTTATAVIMALEHLQAKSITLVTAYPKEITEMESRFLEGNGFKVIKSVAAGISDPFEQAQRDPMFWFNYSKDNFDQNSDALFISCAGIRVVEIISKLEKQIRIPIVTSNQAAMFACIRKLKLSSKVRGYGKLLYS